MLLAKRNYMDNSHHAASWIIAIGVALTIVGDFLGEVSGGLVNPAIALTIMVWQ